jgi:hypothetical protein
MKKRRNRIISAFINAGCMPPLYSNKVVKIMKIEFRKYITLYPYDKRIL